MNKLFLSTPEGEVMINKDKIVAVCSTDQIGDNNTKVQTHIYVEGQEGSFNILEDFEYVTNLL